MAKDQTQLVLGDVVGERVRQDIKWGIQNHPDGTKRSYQELADAAKANCRKADEEGNLSWTDILSEEVMEAFAEVDIVKLRRELIQVAAVAVAWVEDIDRR